MHLATKWLKLESRGFHYKVAPRFSTTICLLSLMTIFKGVPWSGALKIRCGGFQLRGTISWWRWEIELRTQLITNRKSCIGFRLDKSTTLCDLEYKGATVGYCQLSWLLVLNFYQMYCASRLYTGATMSTNNIWCNKLKEQLKTES